MGNKIIFEQYYIWRNLENLIDVYLVTSMLDMDYSIFNYTMLSVRERLTFRHSMLKSYDSLRTR